VLNIFRTLDITNEVKKANLCLCHHEGVWMT